MSVARSVILLLAILGMGVSLGCATRTREKPPQPAAPASAAASLSKHREPIRRASSVRPRIVEAVKVLHGTDPTQNGVGIRVTEGPNLSYLALFGGTAGTFNPELPGTPEIQLTDGWVYLKGSFAALRFRKLWRVPVVVTGIIGVGADATEFIVKRDDATDDSPNLVICLEGTVAVTASGYSNSHPDDDTPPSTAPAPVTVNAGYYLIAKRVNNVVVFDPVKAIPVDPADPVRMLADHAQKLAGGF